MFDAICDIKPRLFGLGRVANPRDTTRYRCGLRLAQTKNPSVLFVASSIKHYTSSLSDFGIVGCECAAAFHFLPASCPIVPLWGKKPAKTGLAGAHSRYRRPKSDRLLGAACIIVPVSGCGQPLPEHVGRKPQEQTREDALELRHRQLVRCACAQRGRKHAAGSDEDECGQPDITER